LGCYDSPRQSRFGRRKRTTTRLDCDANEAAPNNAARSKAENAT
jgi:hypothetical protein